ncbi:MAG TPA: MaoC family dehydratase [Stellaceae bacterium]|nr:MaoC family dehydratase [Stellaceae bacterium]
MRRFANPAELRKSVGETLGLSEWITVSQEMIDRFAEATGDFQWIHVDRERAKASAFGTTIAHGFLTLSLLPKLLGGIWDVGNIGARLNYGCNKVRFIQPVPSGSRLRAGAKLLAVEKIEKGDRVITEATVEREGSDRPVCVAETITVMLPP